MKWKANFTWTIPIKAFKMNWKKNERTKKNCETLGDWDETRGDTTNDIVVNLSWSEITFCHWTSEQNNTQEKKTHSFNLNNTTIYPGATCIKHWYTFDCLHFVAPCSCSYLSSSLFFSLAFAFSLFIECARVRCVCVLHQACNVGFGSHRLLVHRILFADFLLLSIFLLPLQYDLVSFFFFHFISTKNPDTSLWQNEAHVLLSSG